MRMTRRSFVGAATFAGLGLAGCGARTSADSNDAAATWVVTEDDGLDCLTMEVSGGAVVAMTGDGWAPRNGFIQLQLGVGSIPGQEIESATSDGSALTVRLKTDDGPSTLDLVLTEYRLEPPEGFSLDRIESVAVDYGDGKPQELERAYK